MAAQCVDPGAVGVAGGWGGVVIDPTGTRLTQAEFGNALARINGFIATWPAGIPMTGVIFIGG